MQTNTAGSAAMTSRDRLRPHDVALDASPDGHLLIDGARASDLVARFGAPLWVLSDATIRTNLSTIHEAFTHAPLRTRVVYASKANPSPQVLQVVAAEGAMVDVASEGHALLAERAGVHPSRLVVNGNCKTDSYLRWAVASGVAAINIDSTAELTKLIRQLDGRTVNVALRVATDLTRHHDDAGMLRSEMETKFGMSQDEVLRAIDRIGSTDGLELAGLHHHLGFTAFDLEYSARLDLQRRRRVVEQLVDIAVHAREVAGSEIRVFNLGGGFRIATDTGYGPRGVTDMPALGDSVAATAGHLDDLLRRHGLATPEVWIEPGGFVTSNAGVFLAEVGIRKKVLLGRDERDWAFLERTSGYHFVRRLMVDMHHPVLAAARMNEPCSVLIDVAGSTCAPDSVSQPALLPDLRQGDLVALLDQGAYCESVSTEYCSFPVPASVIVRDGTAHQVRRRRTEADLVDDFAPLPH
ncbi:diaminopimelate decarboxylase family protein [Jiangella muralis]|uniref:diaminopimelate decarboxylase family protein n=1 Tax=Jiangella muralis TaxID=702383 RepID=UPI00069DD28D|nr:alanine racemase [Jiangella muralis]